MSSRLILCNYYCFNQYHCCIIGFTGWQDLWDGNIYKYLVISWVRNKRIICFLSICFHDPRMNSDLLLMPMQWLWLSLYINSRVFWKINMLVNTVKQVYENFLIRLRWYTIFGSTSSINAVMYLNVAHVTQ